MSLPLKKKIDLLDELMRGQIGMCIGSVYKLAGYKIL